MNRVDVAVEKTVVKIDSGQPAHGRKRNSNELRRQNAASSVETWI